MPPVKPFWFWQRQGHADEAGENLYRLHGPNLHEAFIGIRRGDNGNWSTFVRTEASGVDVASSEAIYDRELDAWYAAFELYRREFII